MAEISAKDVAALRKITGAGMMDCKRALTETDGDVELAKDWLREKGIAGAESSARVPGRALRRRAISRPSFTASPMTRHMRLAERIASSLPGIT